LAANDLQRRSEQILKGTRVIKKFLTAIALCFGIAPPVVASDTKTVYCTLSYEIHTNLANAGAQPFFIGFGNRYPDFDENAQHAYEIWILSQGKDPGFMILLTDRQSHRSDNTCLYRDGVGVNGFVIDRQYQYQDDFRDMNMIGRTYAVPSEDRALLSFIPPASTIEDKVSEAVQNAPSGHHHLGVRSEVMYRGLLKTVIV